MSLDTDLKTQIHQIFQKIAKRLDQQIDRLETTECSFVDDYEEHNEVAIHICIELHNRRIQL